MKGLLFIILLVLLSFFVHKAINLGSDGLDESSASAEYKNFDGMFGVKFRDVPDEKFTLYKTDRDLGVYAFTPAAPQEFDFDVYGVGTVLPQNIIAAILAMKYFDDFDSMMRYMGNLLFALHKQYGVKPVAMDKNDIMVLSAAFASPMEDDPIWLGMTFRGPANGRDRFLGVCGFRDMSENRYCVRTIAIDYNLAGFDR